MKKAFLSFLFILMFVSCPVLAEEPDWSKVDQAMDKKGAMQEGGVYKIGLPRSDLHITLDGVTLKPGFALGSHVEFLPMDNEAMIMGDLVLTDKEVTPVMKKLLAGGIEISAIHNHLLRTSPPVYYMHIGGHGDAVKLASAIHAALQTTGTPFSDTMPKSSPEAPDFDTKAIDKVFGRSGKMNNGVYQFGFPRADVIKEQDMVIPSAMGVASGVNFQSAGKGKAAITGDFGLLASEVAPVIKALTDNNIEVTALHSHMLDDEPRLFFLHFWAQGDAAKLAKGLKTALDNVNIKKE